LPERRKKKRRTGFLWKMVKENGAIHEVVKLCLHGSKTRDDLENCTEKLQMAMEEFSDHSGFSEPGAFQGRSENLVAPAGLHWSGSHAITEPRKEAPFIVPQQTIPLGLLLPTTAFLFSAKCANPAPLETWLIIAGTSSRGPFPCAQNSTTKVHTKEEVTNDQPK
jgi:hypothetical protein